jgi:hypothetical protein
VKIFLRVPSSSPMNPIGRSPAGRSIDAVLDAYELTIAKFCSSGQDKKIDGRSFDSAATTLDKGIKKGRSKQCQY